VESPPVVVVGAGPTGLATACGLRLGGVAVRVLERASEPAVTSRALGLQPRGAEVLDRLGAVGQLAERNRPIRQVVVSVGDRELARLAVGRPTRRVQRPGLIVSQVEVERALRDRLAGLGATVEWGRTVTDVRGDVDGVDVVLADGQTVRTAWVIGCDGAHSRVRAAAGIPACCRPCKRATGPRRFRSIGGWRPVTVVVAYCLRATPRIFTARSAARA
jgi:2-polyprenyl-6-methoxyphenol hydroxylase-like FAD-dependent oxidoreductase